MSRKTHGHRPAGAYEPIYRTWKNMRARCMYPSNPSFARYGGRGIRICERWASFANFLADMGPHPGDGMSLDRINVDWNYEPANCRWASEAEQQRNRTNNRMITYDGRTQCVTDWAAELGVNPHNLFGRLSRGWSPERAVSVQRATRWAKMVHDGEAMTISEWAAKLGIARNTIARRLKAGMTTAEALQGRV